LDFQMVSRGGQIVLESAQAVPAADVVGRFDEAD
jgi:hypothetical protein